jgi:hypothetical protein
MAGTIDTLLSNIHQLGPHVGSVPATCVNPRTANFDAEYAHTPIIARFPTTDEAPMLTPTGSWITVARGGGESD